MKALLGGKGANLAEMANLGLPVPPGFTISTEVCTAFYANDRDYPEGSKPQVGAALAQFEAIVGAGFGDAGNPLLVSVRSGARASMPGMMDTVLNLGLNDETVEGLAAHPATGASPMTATAASSRCIPTSCWASITPSSRTSSAASRTSATTARHRDHGGLNGTASSPLQGAGRGATGKPFPQDVTEQLWGAVGAVFKSWNGARAITYRKLNNIPEDWGTAVNVQAMVFGNMGETRHRRRLHPQSLDRRQGTLRRVSGQRAGRGCGRRHPHAAEHHRAAPESRQAPRRPRSKR